MTVFLAPDRVQHTLWRHMDETHPLHDKKESEKYRHVIRDVYMKIDDAIGELLDECGDEVTVLIMSDHGSGPYKKVVNLSKWLEMKGYLRFKNNDAHGIGDISRRVSFSISKNVFFRLKKSINLSVVRY